MTSLQVRIVIGLVAVVHLALALFFSSGLVDEEAWLQWGFVAGGAVAAQPALVALWAVMTPHGIAIRLRRTLGFAALACLSVAIGSTLENGGRNGTAVLPALVWTLLFVAALPVFSALRFWLGWRIARPGDLDRAVVESEFSLRALLGWTLGVAVVAAALRWLDGPLTHFDDLCDSLPFFASLGAIGFLLAPVAALITWLVLSTGRHLALKMFVALMALASAIAIGAACWWLFELDGAMYQLGSVLAGFLMSIAVTLLFFRFCGYTLGRRGAWVESMPVPTPTELSGARRRFAVVLTPLLTAVVAFVPVAHRSVEAWQSQAVFANWQTLGWRANLTDDRQLFGLAAVPPAERIGGRSAPFLIDNARFEPLAGQPHLATLNLKGVKLRAAQVGYLARIPNLQTLVLDFGDVSEAAYADWSALRSLTSISLEHCKISDEALMQLARLPRLEVLKLKATDITDAGIAALAGCRKLKTIELLFTRVTRTGVEQLTSALPVAAIYATSIDSRLQNAVLSPGRLCAIRLSSPASVVKLMSDFSRIRWFCGHGPETGDALFALLQFHDKLEYLDVRGGQVTDAAIPLAKTLTGLKRLDLRGTQVSDAGLAQLRQTLPKCRILR